MLNKFKNRNLLNQGTNLKQWGRPPWILFRLADFYLYYAEVLNEIDPNNPLIIDYLDKVRERAGIPGYRQLAEEGKKKILLATVNFSVKLFRKSAVWNYLPKGTATSISGGG